MRAAPGMQVEWVQDEAVVLDPETSRLHYLNSAAALFYALIQEHGYEAALEEARKQREESGTGEELQGLIEQMLEQGLLIDG